MIANRQTLTAKRPGHAGNGVRIKTIALPAEHGGWGFVLEPIALGLLLAPSLAGFCLAISAVGIFLARNPLTLVVVNRRRASPRTLLARRFAALYLIIGGALFVLAFIVAPHWFVVPILIAAPLMVVQLVHDWTGKRRVLLAELAGTVGISSLATAIAICGGLPQRTAFALWAIMIGRAVPAILYVRACLAHLHRRSSSPLPMLLAHSLALAAMVVLFRASLVPGSAIGVMSILLLRALIGFDLARRRIPTAKQLGFTEIGCGAMMILAIWLGSN